MALLVNRPIRSPKQRSATGTLWYRYYAGFSEDFVSDLLSALNAQPLQTVLDPWNGSGTTTVVAARQGLEAHGYDLNPALVVVAKGRHLPTSVIKSLSPLLHEIIALAQDGRSHAMFSPNDPLGIWFDAASVFELRSLERAIYRVLVDEAAISPSLVDPGKLSSLAAFFYCALFTCVRKLTVSFRSSNPTWVRRPKGSDALLRVTRAAIVEGLREAVEALVGRLSLEGSAPAAKLEVRAAEAPHSIGTKLDFVLSSPPYCTRIDYVTTSLPELAVLGHHLTELKALRNLMLGTPTMSESRHPSVAGVSATADAFLMAVQHHPSKASPTYYFRYFQQYLSGLWRSLTCLRERLKPTGTMALVVQDSHYKELHFDLQAILTEMGDSLGMNTERRDFRATNNMARINPRSRPYRSLFGATESLIVLQEA